MALTPRQHGLRIVSVKSGVVALSVPSSSIWAIVATAPDADAGSFPQGEPVLVSDLEAAIVAAGSDGTLQRSLRAIADHGRSIGVVVVVAEGVGSDAGDIQDDLNANVIAGLQKLLLASQLLEVKPQIIGAPGLDTQPVTTALGVLLGKLRGFGYAASIGTTPAAIKTYRDSFNVRELMLIDGDFQAFDADAEDAGTVTSFAVARAIGLRAKLDREVGYHKSISNVAVEGVTGIVAPRVWDPQDANTEMGLINGADVTGLIRRGGYRFWGNRTCAIAGTEFEFESAVRSDQALDAAILDGCFPYVDRPLNRQLAIDIIESINALFRREKLAGHIIGAEAYLAEGNTPDQLAQGKLRIGKRWMFTPPAEDITVESWIDTSFLVDFAQLTA